MKTQPDDWQRVKLGDCCEIVSGATPRRIIPEYWNGNIPWVTPKDISKLIGPVLQDSPEKITQSGYENCSTTLLPKGSILFSSRAPIGLVAIAGKPMCTNQGFKSLIPNSSVDSGYLYWCMKHHANEVAAKGNGTTFKEVSRSVMNDFTIPLPPLEEQKRIAAILDKADTVRRKRQESIRLTEEFLKSVFLDMFGDPVTNPKNWPITKVDDILDHERGGTKCGPFGSALHKSDYIDRGIPVWGIDNVKPNKFIEEGSYFITKGKFNELLPYQVQKGDILISRAGTVGRMCVARPTQEPSMIGSNLIRVSVNHNLITPEYLTTIFTFFPERVGGLRTSSDNAAYSFMRTNVLRQIEIPVPPIDLQQDHLRVLETIQSTKAIIFKLIDISNHLFNSLVQRSFTGNSL